MSPRPEDTSSKTSETPDPGTTAGEAPKSFVHQAWETIKTIVIAVLIAVVIRTFAFEPFSIPSGSMIPTLLVGDYLFVSKYTYGYSRHAFPWSLPPFDGRIFGSPPERGDVVVFKLPADGRTDYIKRVIGLPGDRVQMKQGRLHINDQPVPREQVGITVEDGPFGATRTAFVYQETLPEGRRHLILEHGDASPVDNTREFTVPAGHFFAMGDNRDNSRDSRFLGEVGFVPFVNIVGRAEVIFFSVEGDVWRIWQWPWTVRFDRLFNTIE